MPQYLVAIHHPDNYDPSAESEAMVREIDALNEEMEAAGARFFAGGLQSSAPRRKSLRVSSAAATRWSSPMDHTLEYQGTHRRFLDTRRGQHG